MQIIHNPRFGQRILAIFVCLVTAVLAFMPSVSVSFQSLVSDTVSYIPGTVLEVVEEDLSPSDLKGGPQLGEQTLTIELKDGSQITLTNYLTNTHNILAREGMRVVVCVDAPENVEPYYTLYQYDRSVGLGVAVAIFLLLMLLVGGEKGFYATLALAFSLVFLLKITVPVIYSGGSPILAGLAMVLVSTAVTVFLIYGLSPRGVLGIGVVLAGEFVACGLFLLFSLLLHLSGFKSSDAENLLVAAQNTGLNISTVLARPLSYQGTTFGFPKCLIKSFTVDILNEKGEWESVYETKNNIGRYICKKVKKKAKAVRFIAYSTYFSERLHETYGSAEAHLFAFEVF